MRRTIYIGIALICGLVLLSNGYAGAQEIPTPEGMGLGYAIYAGAAFPVNSLVKTKSMVNVGVSWYGPISNNVGGQNSALGLSVDWIPFTRSDGTQISLLPIMINYKAYAPLGGYRIFANFGAGVIGATASAPELDLSSNANFGWTGGFGVDITNNLFIQYRFIGGSNPGVDGLNSAQLGYRF